MGDFDNVISVISIVLRFLSAASIGIFAGAMLTEAFVLVPYWRSLPPAQFFSWYEANGWRLQSFFGPLTTVTGLLASATAIVCLWQGHPGRWFSIIGAVIL